jgi:surface antigen
MASRYGHIAVVERLLQDPRVDPSADDDDAFDLASKYGHVAVVNRLLQDPRVNKLDA